VQDGVPECAEHSGVDFQIVTDKLVYAPKSKLLVKFLVTNTDFTQRRDSSTGLYEFRVLYLDRILGYCSGPLGGDWLEILDRNNKPVPIQKCFYDVVMEKVDAVEVLTNPKTGIALQPGDVFGTEAEIQLPAKKGKYRLNAQLFTGWFPEKQLQALAEKRMQILPQSCTISAPVVTITVR
jgi:hypothetical protein